MDDDFDDHFNARLAGGNVLAYLTESADGREITVYKIRLAENLPKRTGYGTAAIKELASKYPFVRAEGITDDAIPFWRAMLKEGLLQEGFLWGGIPLTLDAE